MVLGLKGDHDLLRMHGDPVHEVFEQFARGVALTSICRQTFPYPDHNIRLEVCRREATDRTGLVLASSEQGGADIEWITNSVLDRVAWAHPIAPIVVDQPRQEGPRPFSSPSPAFAVLLEELLDRLERDPVNDGLVLAGEPLAGMAGFAKVGAIFQQIGEGAVAEGDSSGEASGDRTPFGHYALGV